MGLKSLFKSMPPGVIDLIMAPFVLGGGYFLRFLRRFGMKRTPLCRSILMKLGVFPLLDWYYDPMFNPRHLKGPLGVDRAVGALDLRADEQIKLLKQFEFTHELLAIPRTGAGTGNFYFCNEYFGPGDAEYLYNMVRLFKPARMIEIGSGFSTLIAKMAMDANRRDNPGYECDYTCIEPYESGWLEDAGFRVLRQRVEDVGIHLFESLDDGDFLFIDSSHIIRPQGDVLYEFLELLPTLGSGVVVHIHDIFTPKDYPRKWIYDELRFWNEQYLLEAFLNFNSSFQVIGALNFLKHHHPKQLFAVCPILQENRLSAEPSSFWMRKV
ncbi:MAG: class I SAM-dependent methyltransferase [Desulfobacteraceae bacterium]|nr:class I SAM-dependent methyltransferase [Desulfobacteraceae bacterium]